MEEKSDLKKIQTFVYFVALTFFLLGTYTIVTSSEYSLIKACVIALAIAVMMTSGIIDIYTELLKSDKMAIFSAFEYSFGALFLGMIFKETSEKGIAGFISPIIIFSVVALVFCVGSVTTLIDVNEYQLNMTFIKYFLIFAYILCQIEIFMIVLSIAA